VRAFLLSSPSIGRAHTLFGHCVFTRRKTRKRSAAGKLSERERLDKIVWRASESTTSTNYQLSPPLDHPRIPELYCKSAQSLLRCPFFKILMTTTGQMLLPLGELIPGLDRRRDRKVSRDT